MTKTTVNWIYLLRAGKSTFWVSIQHLHRKKLTSRCKFAVRVLLNRQAQRWKDSAGHRQNVLTFVNSLSIQSNTTQHCPESQPFQPGNAQLVGADTKLWLHDLLLSHQMCNKSCCSHLLSQLSWHTPRAAQRPGHTARLLCVWHCWCSQETFPTRTVSALHSHLSPAPYRVSSKQAIS